MLSQYQPLFLKYRPQAISEIAGQEHIVITLTNALKYNRISHAYLFTGPRGTGKTSAARIFAKSLNCELGPTAEPCQKCTSCIEIKQGISPSVFEIDAASNNSVDDARLLIERAPLSACGGRFKLYIIDECHMLTKEAFNALLKTIEEPPANVIFILATTEEHKVLPTIVSRCQKLMFRLINDQVMFDHLSTVAEKENIVIEKEALQALVVRANGGLRDALSLLDQVSLLGSADGAITKNDVLLFTGALPEDVLSQMCAHIFKKEGQEVLLLLQELFVSGREAHLIASELAKYMLGLAKASYEEEQTGKPSASSDLAKLIDQSELIQMIEQTDRLEVACRRSSQPVMNLEIGLLSLCQRVDIGQWKSIQLRLQKLEQALGLTGENTDLEDENILKEYKPSKTKSMNEVDQTTNQQKEEILSDFDDFNEQSDPIIKSEKGEVKNDIDVVWQTILTELQRRHLPTFSLVSTHAFPIEITDSVLTVGVFVENFQKMIESKIEYIKMAALACNLDKHLKVTVKLQTDDQTTMSNQKKKEINKTESMTISAKSSKLAIEREDNLALTDLQLNDEKQHQNTIKEAYRLFEGPGSRYIAPSQ